MLMYSHFGFCGTARAHTHTRTHTHEHTRTYAHIQFVVESDQPKASYIIPTRQLVITSYVVLGIMAVETIIAYNVLVRACVCLVACNLALHVVARMIARGWWRRPNTLHVRAAADAHD